MSIIELSRDQEEAAEGLAIHYAQVEVSPLREGDAAAEVYVHYMLRREADGAELPRGHRLFISDWGYVTTKAQADTITRMGARIAGFDGARVLLADGSTIRVDGTMTAARFAADPADGLGA